MWSFSVFTPSCNQNRGQHHHHDDDNNNNNDDDDDNNNNRTTDRCPGHVTKPRHAELTPGCYIYHRDSPSGTAHT
ncbi:hypothetical protein F2P81_021236 [Scophthalmus maximus]|uniref:Uncharacterized protein n=1 Tax=Scophthalmus maximus TaxID=52904 RepID=A0A6A4S1T2_SCOMX|nr:hypothetical protein F2P81_021236 [Scophthalmus maximus]